MVPFLSVQATSLRSGATPARWAEFGLWGSPMRLGWVNAGRNG
jgi:hypothetical protein